MDDINFAHISAKGLSYGISLYTANVPVSRVTIEDVRAEVMAHSSVGTDTAGVITDVTLRGIDFFVKPMETPLTEEVRRGRGETVLSCRNVNGLRLQDVRFFFDEGMRDLWTNTLSVENCTEEIL